ncbi:MAG: alpha/beta hydrolase [Eubacterium sp.]|nr:alpha/beta hydrolase [Eubacterium sp.]
MGSKKKFDFKFLGFVLLVILAFNLSAIITFFLRFNMLMQRPYSRISVKWSDEVGKIYNDLPVGDGKVLYDLYVPEGLDSSAKQHLVMYIHSGNFSSGDKDDAVFIGRYLASKGYIMAAVNYTPVDESKGFGVDDAVNELYGTADTVVKKCKELGYDIENMAVCGEYAGGTLALLYGSRAPEKSPVPVVLVFEQTGPTSFDPEKWGYQGEEAVSLVNMMTGSSFTVDDIGSDAYIKAYKEISPDNYTGADHVPVIMAYGLKDKIVPSAMASEYSGALKKAGVDAVLIEFPKSGHLMIQDKDKNVLYYDTVDSYLEKYMLK